MGLDSLELLLISFEHKIGSAPPHSKLELKPKWVIK